MALVVVVVDDDVVGGGGSVVGMDLCRHRSCCRSFFDEGGGA